MDCCYSSDTSHVVVGLNPKIEIFVCKTHFLSTQIDISCFLSLPAGRDSADKVVTSGGKYEELIVCSHEIAASTAQLVAASKVQHIHTHS